jgi:cytochrome P450
MTATDESVVTRFNPLDPQLIDDPYPIYARYRELDPVHWGIASNPALPGSWFLFRYAENSAVLIDTATFASNPETVGMQSAVPPAFAPVTAIFHRWLGAIDPPDHAKLRSIMSKAFTPWPGATVGSTSSVTCRSRCR